MLAAQTLASLGPPYTTVVAPTPLPAPRPLFINQALARELDLPALAWAGPEGLELLAGNRVWPAYAPRATVYAGHQFGRYTAQLGDGRALLLAELDTPQGPIELQLKGAGPTPYARGADGRAVLRSSVRETLASVAMHALGVPTTQALSLVASPLPVQRDQAETAAVVCRVAPSFLRFGHFEYHARQAQPQRLALLAHHVIERHFQHLADISSRGERHARWLQEVIERQARLIAAWQTLGFCHGVMNTDNASVLGLTLDYGPFGFMERFRSHHVCNHSDTDGRYAYRAQPAVGQWNCARLLDACAPLLHDDTCEAARLALCLLARYAPAYDSAVMQRWRAKLGLHEVRAGDAALVNRLLTLMQQGRCDFTQTFRALGGDDPRAQRSRFADPAAFDAWCSEWLARAAAEGVSTGERRQRMNCVNPKFVLRNHLAQAATDAAEQGDPTELQLLLRVLQRPYDEDAGPARLAEAAETSQPELEVSCSS